MKRKCLTTSSGSSSAMLRLLSSPVLNQTRRPSHSLFNFDQRDINRNAGSRAVVVEAGAVALEATARELAVSRGRVVRSQLETVVPGVDEVMLEAEAAAAQSRARVDVATAYAAALVLTSLLLTQPRSC
jgi:hypothetical protein